MVYNSKYTFCVINVWQYFTLNSSNKTALTHLCSYLFEGERRKTLFKLIFLNHKLFKQLQYTVTLGLLINVFFFVFYVVKQIINILKFTIQIKLLPYCHPFNIRFTLTPFLVFCLSSGYVSHNEKSLAKASISFCSHVTVIIIKWCNIVLVNCKTFL